MGGGICIRPLVPADRTPTRQLGGTPLGYPLGVTVATNGWPIPGINDFARKAGHRKLIQLYRQGYLLKRRALLISQKLVGVNLDAGAQDNCRQACPDWRDHSLRICFPHSNRRIDRFNGCL